MAEPDGTAVLEQPSQGVILIVMQGRVGGLAGRTVARQLSNALKDGGPKKTFWDLEAMVDYHSDVRTHCTQALLSNLANVTSVVVIAKSKLVKMGVAVANVALGGRIQSLDNRAKFDAALRAAVTSRASVAPRKPEG
jgi:hypothetical protein